jgi:hypothetical protein
MYLHDLLRVFPSFSDIFHKLECGDIFGLSGQNSQSIWTVLQHTTLGAGPLSDSLRIAACIYFRLPSLYGLFMPHLEFENSLEA